MMTKRIYGWLSCLAIAGAVCGMPNEASASLLELRASYALQSTDPGEVNSYFGPGVKKLGTMNAFGVDALAMLPLLPVGLGLRYEKYMRSESGADADYERVSLLINKRLIDTGLYMGLIGSFGLTNDFEYKVSGTTYRADEGPTGSIGVEAGLNLILLKVGAEAGYLYAPLGNLKNSIGGDVVNASGGKIDTDLSGTYIRAVVGIGF